MSARRRIVRGAAVSTAGALLLGAAVGTPATAGDLPTSPNTNRNSTLASTPATLTASALLPWYVAPSLVALRGEINARWPNRDRSSDGTIGDTRHQSRGNSHNAVGHSGGPGVGSTGAVHAMDITSSGIDVQSVLRALIGDSRVWYVIYGGRIWSRTYGWAAQTYTGDPHTTHIHVNLREDSQSAAVAAEQDTSHWLGGAANSNASGAATFTPAFSLTLGGAATAALQRALISRGYPIPAGATGVYGAQTTAAVRAFQLAQGWTGSAADGVAGTLTLSRLGVTASNSAASTNATPATHRTSPASAGRGSSGSSGAYRPGTASRAVYFLQQALIARGYPIPAGATGYYGAKTVAAVEAFQRAQGWSGSAADGVAGPGTIKRLGLA